MTYRNGFSIKNKKMILNFINSKNQISPTFKQILNCRRAIRTNWQLSLKAIFCCTLPFPVITPIFNDLIYFSLQTFDSRLDLNSHFLTDHGSEQDLSDKILCAQCLIPIERGKIREHLRLEHPHQRYVCTECGRECLFPSQLKQHWKGQFIHFRDFVDLF